MGIELSRVVGTIVGFANPAPSIEDRERIGNAVGVAETWDDLSDDIKELLSKMVPQQSRHLPRQEDRSESRFLSKVDREVVRVGDNCPECQANTDPRRIPLHPGCNCEIMTSNVEVGVEGSSFAPAERWIRENGVLKFVQGNTGFPEVDVPESEEPTVDRFRLQAGSVTVLDIEDARFSDIQKWLEQVQPLLDLGDSVVSIVVEEGEQVVELGEVAMAAEAGADLLSGRMMLAIAKVVV